MNSNHRPQKFKTFTGQKKIKKTLKVMIHSALLEARQIDHILFHGPAGTGKTTLATIVANEAKRPIKYIQASWLEKKVDLISILSNLQTHEILFIDEFHSLPKTIEELIYSIMEDFVLDIIIGAEANSKIVRLKIKPFTLVAATTRIERIPKPLKDRFGFIANLDSYSDQDLEKIGAQLLKKANLEIDEESLRLVVSYAQRTPRIIHHLIRRIAEFAFCEEKKTLKKHSILKIFQNLGLYQYGLNEDHARYLCILKNNFQKRSVSLGVLSNLLHENRDKIYNEIEPLLIQYKLIFKNSQGRQLSSLGLQYCQQLLCQN